MILNYRAFFSWLKTHKKTAFAVTLCVILAGYGMVSAISGDAQPPSYVIAAVERGTLVASVTANGQISATSQVQLVPKGSGTVTSVAQLNGAKVRAGTLLVQLDSADQWQAVQNAQLDLSEARIALTKLGQNQFADIPELEADLVSSYGDGFDTVFDVFKELPAIRESADTILHDNDLASSCATSICEHGIDATFDKAEVAFQSADTAYDTAFQKYQTTGRNDSPGDVTLMLTDTTTSVELLGQAMTSERNVLDALVDDLHGRKEFVARLTQLQKLQVDATTAITTLNQIRATLTGAQRAIADAKRSLVDARDAGPLDLESSQNGVERAQLSLRKAQSALADRSVRAPFAGVVSGLEIKRGDSVTSGTVVATLITDQRVAELSFNEVDIARLKSGQKSTLTFDAIDGLTLTGAVGVIDAVGTVTQGVVTYEVKVFLDTQDERVLPGMSVSAAIVTDVRTDVLILPAAAVKGSGADRYVQVPGTDFPATAVIGTPVAFAGRLDERGVTVGLSSDTQAEILSGVSEGDLIVARTIATSTAQGSSQTPTLFQTGANRGGAGSGVRTFRAP